MGGNMFIINRLKKTDEVLMVIPDDFEAWLQNKAGWEKTQASEILLQALKSKEKQDLLRAFHCCRSLFKKAYSELLHNQYTNASRYYASAGFIGTGYSMIKRWGLDNFEDNLACNIFNNHYSEMPASIDLQITRMLPANAPCPHCGKMLARPVSAQGHCPNCNYVVTYAEKERGRIKAEKARTMYAADYQKARARFSDPVAAHGDYGTWAPPVEELFNLVKPYL
jgi:hypothetical protein